MMGRGLTHLKDRDLENILRALHRGDLECPVTPQHLMMGGLSYLQDRLDHLRGLDKAGVQAVLVAVLAERRK